MNQEIKVGLCGLGVVGSGVYRLLSENFDLIRLRTGVDVRVVRAATIDPYDHLGIDTTQTQVTDSVEAVLSDPEVDVVVELIGGAGIAKTVILDALARNKSVVTANKALLAEHSKEVFGAAYQSRGMLGFEASVAGGIPIIRSLRHGFAGDRIEAITGIVNGTANYILSAMSRQGIDFDTALKAAQEKGYAEADPTLDVEGIDAAHKILLLMALAYHRYFDFNRLYVEGIIGIEPLDIKIAERLGFVIKLLAKSRPTAEGFEGRVHPALIRSDSLLASVQDAFNAVWIQGNFVGPTMEYGAGAGSFPTASAVVSDILEISRLLTSGHPLDTKPLTVAAEQLETGFIIPMERIEMSYCLRIDLNGTVPKQKDIFACLSEHGIVLSSLQRIGRGIKNKSGDSMAVTTEKTAEDSIQKALKCIRALPGMAAQTVKLFRIEDGTGPSE